MGIRFSLAAVVALVLAAFLGVKAAGLNYFFGVTVPYIAIFAFLGGIVFRVLKWARSPVPFRIPTTAGQQKSLPWITQSKLDNPVHQKADRGQDGPGSAPFPLAFQKHQVRDAKRTQVLLPVGKMALARRACLPLLLSGHPDKASALFHRAGALFRP